jgi:hypothetical protein
VNRQNYGNTALSGPRSNSTDLKRELSAVSDECHNIPEVGHLTRKKRRRGEDKPLSLGIGERANMQGILDVKQQETRRGFERPAGESGQMTNLLELSQVRDKLLSLELDQVCFFPFLFVLPFQSFSNIFLKKIDNVLPHIPRPAFVTKSDAEIVSRLETSV